MQGFLEILLQQHGTIHVNKINVQYSWLQEDVGDIVGKLGLEDFSN